MSEKLRAALQELVRLKKLHDEVSRLKQRRAVAFRRDPEQVAEFECKEAEYKRCKPIAWAAAEAALSAQEAPASQPSELVWLFTHCRAIGMTAKSDSGKMEHDIALFTIDLQAALKAAQSAPPAAQDQSVNVAAQERRQGNPAVTGSQPTPYESLIPPAAATPMPLEPACPRCEGRGRELGVPDYGRFGAQEPIEHDLGPCLWCDGGKTTTAALKHLARLAYPKTKPLEPVAPQDFKAWLQSACDAVEEALLDHRLSEWVCEDDETSNFPLLDHLSHDKDTGSGRREIEMLAETVFFALEKHGPFAAPISAQPPSADAVAPDWDIWSDIFLRLNAMEAAQGGRTGPSIQLRDLLTQIRESKG